MKTLITIPLCVVAFACFTLTAHAQAQRTFVSTSGVDTNTASLCNTTNPCRTFTAAQTVTNAGGEIIALTSGGYGPVEITKSIQLTSPLGVYAAITAQPATAIGGTDAIRVNAGVNDIVVIRGLTLNNVGTMNANGITFPAGARLYVESCVINGFDNQGISVDRSAAGNPEVFVTDTTIRNGGAGTLDAGIFLRQTTSGNFIRTTIDNCRFERAGFSGLLTVDGALTTARNTVAARNTNGFVVAATTGTTAQLNLENCTATHNGSSGILVGDIPTFIGGVATARVSNTASVNNSFDGIFLNTNGTAHISNSTVNGNSFDGIDISANGTAHISDSTINGNGDDGVQVRSNATAHISTSTISKNASDGMELSNDATSRVYVATTTISNNGVKGLNRNGATSIAVSTGSNNILNNPASDAFSSTIAQQ